MGFWERIRMGGKKAGEPRIEYGFRGEGINYERGGKAIELDFTWCDGDRLYTETISKWTSGEPLTDTEKEKVFLDVLRFLSGPLRRTIVVVNVDDPSHELWEQLARNNIKLIKEVEYDSLEKQHEFERQMYLDTLNRQKELIINDVKITSVEELDSFLNQLRKTECNKV